MCGISTMWFYALYITFISLNNLQIAELIYPLLKDRYFLRVIECSLKAHVGPFICYVV